MPLMLLGAPGAGKGTPADFIQNRSDIPRFFTSSMLCGTVKTGSALGVKAKAVISEDINFLAIGLVIRRDRAAQEVYRGFLSRRVRGCYALDAIPNQAPKHPKGQDPCIFNVAVSN